MVFFRVKMIPILTILLIGGAAIVRGSEVCCREVGCFRDEGIFRHLPLPECPEDLDLRIGLFTASTPNTPSFFQSSSAVPSEFDASKRTVFLVHGYRNDFDTWWLHEAKDELIAKEGANVVIVGWGDGASYVWYPWSAANTRTIGAHVALIADSLKSAGADSSDIWCVGFSLGAHMCGFTGMTSRIGRITGLDPAGPYFDGYDLQAGLNKDAADFVDVIHTDGAGIAAFYGLLTPRGDVDYYPNEGKYQPGCWTYYNIRGREVKIDNELNLYGEGLSCSHSRAPKYFMESLRNPGCFTARDVCTEHEYLPTSCSSCASGVCGMMGYEADRYTTMGLLYLESTGNAPYCKY